MTLKDYLKIYHTDYEAIFNFFTNEVPTTDLFQLFDTIIHKRIDTLTQFHHTSFEASNYAASNLSYDFCKDNNFARDINILRLKALGNTLTKEDKDQFTKTYFNKEYFHTKKEFTEHINHLLMNIPTYKEQLERIQ